jgi:transcriptional regulator with XRE-family HTH domain
MRAECAEVIGNTRRFDAGTLVRMDGLVDRIREVMELRGWTAYEFAHRAQLSDSILSNWLRRGVKRPDIEALNKLAAAAGVRVEWLRDGTGARDIPTFSEAVQAATMQARENFDGSLVVARVKRPQYGDYLWDAIAHGDPLMVAPMTPGLLVDLADALVNHISAPPPPPKPRT